MSIWTRIVFQRMYRDLQPRLLFFSGGVIMNQNIFPLLRWSRCPYCVSYLAIIFFIDINRLGTAKTSRLTRVTRPLTATGLWERRRTHQPSLDLREWIRTNWCEVRTAWWFYRSTIPFPLPTYPKITNLRCGDVEKKTAVTSGDATSWASGSNWGAGAHGDCNLNNT